MSACVKQTLPCITIGDEYDWTVAFRVLDQAGAAIPLADTVLWFTMKETLDDTDADALSGDKGLQVKHTFPDDSESALGNGVVNIPRVKTEVLIPIKYEYSFKWEPSPGVPKTLGAGKIPVVKRATQSHSGA